MPRRKAYKKSSNRSKRRRRSLLGVLLFIFSFGFLSVVSFVKYTRQNLAFALSDSAHSIRGDMYPTLMYVVVDSLDDDLVSVSSLNYLILDRDAKKVVTYEFPVSMTVEVPGRFGEEEISKVVALGTLDSNGQLEGGISLLSRTVSKLVGYKVDKYILVTSEFKPVLDRYLTGGDLFSLLRSTRNGHLKTAMRTDLSVKEFFYINDFLSSLSSERFFHKNFGLYYVEQPGLLDEEIRDITFDSSIAQEGLDIAVLNGTNVPGVASYGARVVRNMGGRVVAIGNSSKEYKESVLVHGDSDDLSVGDLAYVFGIEDIRKAPGDISEEVLGRADVVIILGFDFAKNL